MESMKALDKLGFPSNSKLLIIHADDAGLSHSENLATIETLQNGCVNSYSIMVPCPNFEEIADFAIDNGQFDYGIHLTLTCEWKNYKWPPVLSINEVPSLVEGNGYFHSSKENFRVCAIPKEVKNELRAQIDKALAYGLQPTHLDCHMYTLGLNLDFFKIYKELGIEYGLPVFLSKQIIESFNLKAEEYIKEIDFYVDEVFIGNYEVFKNGNLLDYYKGILNNIKEGLNILLLHPAIDDEEMRSICIDHPNFGAQWRQIDLDFISSEHCKELLKKNDIQLITWGDIKEKLYSSSI
jgi:predicted glycoside hydrolase/deacetylase ChbG (UPF0249 family)